MNEESLTQFQMGEGDSKEYFKYQNMQEFA